MSDICHMYENERKNSKYRKCIDYLSQFILLFSQKDIFFVIFILQVSLVKYIFLT